MARFQEKIRYIEDLMGAECSVDMDRSAMLCRAVFSEPVEVALGLLEHIFRNWGTVSPSGHKIAPGFSKEVFDRLYSRGDLQGAFRETMDEAVVLTRCSELAQLVFTKAMQFPEGDEREIFFHWLLGTLPIPFIDIEEEDVLTPEECNALAEGLRKEMDLALGVSRRFGKYAGQPWRAGAMLLRLIYRFHDDRSRAMVLTCYMMAAELDKRDVLRSELPKIAEWVGNAIMKHAEEELRKSDPFLKGLPEIEFPGFGKEMDEGEGGKAGE